MRSPCAGVPLPGGKPVPSGRILMPEAFTSDSEIGCPRLGPCASAGAATSAATSTNLGVDMAHLAFSVDRPARDRIEMLVGERRHRERRGRLAARGDERGARRLRVPGLVPGAAL